MNASNIASTCLNDTTTSKRQLDTLLKYKQSLAPIGPPPDLDTSTDERFSPEYVTAVKDNPDKLETNPDNTYLYHYQQTQCDWGGVEALTPMLDEMDIAPRDRPLTATIIGGFTGELAQALADIGFEVVFTDPMSAWVEQAKDVGFEAYKCAAGELPVDVLMRTDVFATFECYYPFKTAAQYSLYNLLRLLTAPEGILLAETRLTREIREASESSSRSNLIPIDIVEHHFGTCWRAVDSSHQPIRLYQYNQDLDSQIDILTVATIARRLYELGADSKETVIDGGMVHQLGKKLGCSTDEAYQRLIKLKKVYKAFLDNKAAVLSSEDVAIGGRRFYYNF